MSTARHRSRDARYSSYGDCVNVDDELIAEQTFPYNGKVETCDDILGNRSGDNFFELYTQENRRWELNGVHKNTVTGGIRKFRSMPVSGSWIVPPSESHSPLSSLELNNLALKTLARTNPSAPHLSVPTFLAELRDLPSLIRDWGGDLLKKVAKGWISWRWAVKPMISDIRALLNFQRAVNQRVKELTRLRDGKELKKRVGLGSTIEKDDWIDGVLVHSKSGLVINGRTRIVHSDKRWASVRYRVLPSFAIPTDESELNRLAWRLTTGITSFGALATVWEILPWSWLIDWFAGVGDAITLLNNSVPMTHSSVCVMRTSEDFREWRVEEAEFVRLLTGVQREARTRKVRLVVAPIFPFQISFPILDWGKWSILGSLAVLRRKRR